MRLAAVDVGTNTARLLVADAVDAGLTDVERSLRITRLGQGVDAAGHLSQAAVERTLAAVVEHVERARELGAERVRVAGTSALRDAADRDRFADLVAERTGLELEVLTGAEEGRAAYAGACLAVDDPGCVLDIGGGSTELITASGQVSIDIGSVRLRERYLADDPPTVAQLEEARVVVASALRAAMGRLELEVEGQLVGVAGTITTLAALHLGLRDYDPERVEGTRLSAEVVREWSARINAMTTSEVLRLGPVPEGRADVIGGGVLICVEAMAALDAPDLVVSEHDILDGLVLGLV